MADIVNTYVWESTHKLAKMLWVAKLFLQVPNIIWCACCFPYFSLTGLEWRADLLVTEDVVGALAICGHCRLRRRSVGKYIVQIVELMPVAPS